MLKSNPKISIIIVHYKVKKELFNCLDSIEKSRPLVSYEVIVVDNDEEKTIDKEIRIKYPFVRYVPNPVNNGWGGGVNAGVKYANGEYIYLLNPDTIVKNGVVDILMKFMNKERDIGVASSTLLDRRGKRYPLQGTGFLTPLVALFAFSFINKIIPRNPVSRKFWLLDADRKMPYRVDVAPLSASLVKKELFKKIGGFDENFFLYFEEYDFANKIRKVGYENYILPASKVIHIWGASAKKTGKTQEYIKESRKYYFSKYYGKLSALFIEFFLGLSRNNILLTTVITLVIALVILLAV